MQLTQTYVKPLLSITCITVLIYWVMSSFIFKNPVFDFNKKTKIESSNGYYQERMIRNAKAMAMSYDDLMGLGDQFVEEENWPAALENYAFAKSIYPENIDVRTKMCYVYLRLCQRNMNICSYAKREIYYAMQHTSHASNENTDYLNRLVQLVDIQDIVVMDEKEALAAIF